MMIVSVISARKPSSPPRELRQIEARRTNKRLRTMPLASLPPLVPFRKPGYKRQIDRTVQIFAA